MALFLALVDHAGPDPQEPLRSLIGQHAAELWTLRLMSLSVAAKLASGEDPMLEASIVKDLGNSLEQDLPRLVQASVDRSEERRVGKGCVRTCSSRWST